MNLYNLEHELRLISAAVYDPACLDEIQIRPEQLYDRRHVSILKVIEQLIAEGRKPDLPLIYEQTKVDPSYLAKIEPVTAANVEFYANSIRQLARGRELYKLSQTLAENLKKNADPEVVIDQLEKDLTELNANHAATIEGLHDLVPALIDQLEDTYKNKGKLPGIPTGFDKLDQLTGGLQKGEFIVLGSRPSIGKTAMALSIARNAAAKGHVVGFFSLEQSQSPMRLLSAEARVNIGNMRSGYLAESQFRRLVDGASKLYNLRILFDHHSAKLADIKSNARRMVRRYEVQLVFIDYITLIQHSGAQMNMFERIGEISHELKSLAQELNIPVVALSQLRRETEDRRPTLADLRMSGEIEQDADVVIFLHRDRKAEDGITVVDVAKQRNGPVDEFRVKFLPEFVRFEDTIPDGR